MSVKTIKSTVNVEEYFHKMKPEDSAAIVMMCISKLASKVDELDELYSQLAKTYGFEMGICGITCIAQLSAETLPHPVVSMLGTDEGINKGLNILKTEAINHGFKLDNKEANND